MRKRGKYEKYGKYEKRPEGASEKQPKVKSMLLQAYFAGLLSLVLCVTMFFGTSYAWFTSEVNNTGNEIYVGTLKVGLYKDSTNLNGSDTKLFDGNIRWEPGYTALETITVRNEGDLAFKYVLNFTDGSLAAGSTAALETVAARFEVRVCNGTASPASYAEITEENGWTQAVSLADLLTGQAVLSGEMEAAGAAATYTVALHMKEDADAEVMGEKISLNVKLIAYQKDYVPAQNG